MSERFEIGTAEDLKQLEKWFVVDIGFSNNKTSCGVYTSDTPCQGEDLSFADMITELKEFSKDKKRVGLIIEAPLSVCFENGNPQGRNPLESEGGTRYWYTGAGAIVFIAALELLKNLRDGDFGGTAFYLFEGFVSRKKDNDRAHWEDARLLFNARSCCHKEPNKNSNDWKFIGHRYLGIDQPKAPLVIKADHKDCSTPS